MNLNSVTSAAAEKALNSLWMRQRTISDNIANEDTPGYKAKRLSFEEALKKELDDVKRGKLSRREAVNRISSSSVREYEIGGLVSRIDGNNVDLDSEYIELYRTQTHFSALQQSISGRYSTLKYVIGEGR